MNSIRLGRSVKVNGMAYGPTNEQGVVYLFGRLAPRIGFRVETVQTHFPDCVAVRKGKRVRIEFEYRASSYMVHGHPPKGAEVIVCWDNDWDHRPKAYRHLEIIDLKKYVGALPSVYVVGCDENVRGAHVDKYQSLPWSVPMSAQVGDLILMYRTKPASEIRDLWTIRGPFYTDKKWGLQAWLKNLVRLNKPITFDALKKDHSTRNLSVVRKQFTGKSDISNDWPLLHSMIAAANPKTSKLLRPYDFE